MMWHGRRQFLGAGAAVGASLGVDLSPLSGFNADLLQATG